MEPADLRAVWSVLETAAVRSDSQSLHVRPAGHDVAAGAVLVGIDAQARRHLLVPLSPGEAFAEDRTGRGVQLRRIDIEGTAFADVICLVPALNFIFERLCREILHAVADQDSPARATADVLRRWKELLAAGGVPGLGNDQLIGLLAELLCLESILKHDVRRRIDVWAGPLGGTHDLSRGAVAVEVKAISAREGRVIGISSVDQLDRPPNGALFLAFHRFQPAQRAEGLSLPMMIGRIIELGVDADEFHRRLLQVGYSPIHDEEYAARPFHLAEQVIYDTSQASFPKITRSSFAYGDIPPGTLRLSYSIDLTNSPPVPLHEAEVDNIWDRIAK